MYDCCAHININKQTQTHSYTHCKHTLYISFEVSYLSQWLNLIFFLNYSQTKEEKNLKKKQVSFNGKFRFRIECLHVVVVAVNSNIIQSVTSTSTFVRTSDIICHARIIQINTELCTKFLFAFESETKRLKCVTVASV